MRSETFVSLMLAVNPEILLMDEPASAVDPIATSKTEDLIAELRKELTVVFVTHSMAQASRVSEVTALFNLGEIIEVGPTQQIFTRPKEKRTVDYITGRFGEDGPSITLDVRRSRGIDRHRSSADRLRSR